MKELHLTEGRNTGFKKILDALEANGSPKPEFETDEGRTYFISRFYVHEGFEKENVPVNVPDYILLQFPEGKREKIEIIIELVSRNKGIVRDELAEEMGVTKRTVGRYLKEMKEKGIIERVGSDKTGYWIIK